MSTSAKATVLAGFLALVVAVSLVGSAGAASTPLSPYHEPPWLVVRGQPLTLAYALVDKSVRGTAYVRNDLQKTFLRVPLTWGRYCPGDPVDAPAMQRDKVCGDALLAQVPAELISGSKLFYYAVLRDGAGGRSGSVTVPSGGAAAPQRVWIVRRLSRVSLGVHHFGHLRAADATVAQAGPADVGVVCCSDPPGGDGPSSFDVAPDGSTWMLDRLAHRLLVWQRGRPERFARAIPLPRKLSIADFALGPDGTIYARAVDTADLGRGSKSHLYALTPTGRIRWQAPTTAGIGTAQLQIGPDGRLYAAQACGGSCAPFGGHTSWTPLTTRAGSPLSLRDRRSEASPFEPLSGGLRLVSQLSYSVARFALVDRSDRIVRAWQVTSRTRLGAMRAAPALVDGDLVVPLEVTQGARYEQQIVRLAPNGVRRQFALSDRPVLGDAIPFVPMRIGADGSLYQLQTSVTTGARIARYSLGTSQSTQFECGG